MHDVPHRLRVCITLAASTHFHYRCSSEMSPQPAKVRPIVRFAEAAAKCGTEVGEIERNLEHLLTHYCIGGGVWQMHFCRLQQRP